MTSFQGSSAPGSSKASIIFRFRAGAFELPDVFQLPVTARAAHAGRFVMWSRPDAGVSLEARVVAVAIADQVGAALAVAGDRDEPGGTRPDES
jgi:hypothetical protein